MRRRFPRVLIGLLVAVLITAGCGEEAPGPAVTTEPGATGTGSPPASPTESVDPLFDRGTVAIATTGGEVRLNVEIARTDPAREQGLMHRTELAADAGMVFVFAEEAPRAFWMKNTLIPLSIAFFDAGGRIVSMFDMEPCGEDPCPFYESGAPAQGALEVNAGAFEDLGVGVGDTVTLEE